MPILECRRVVFFSQGDEAAFFSQLQANKGVRKVEGVGDTLLLHVATSLSDRSLRELLGAFRRYKVRMDQLAQFSSVRNRDWFENPRAYWFTSVFGRGHGRKRRTPKDAV